MSAYKINTSLVKVVSILCVPVGIMTTILLPSSSLAVETHTKTVTSKLNETEKWLNNRIFEAMSDKHAPSYSVGIILDGQVALQKSYGVLDVTTKTPTTLTTTYQVASITKTFVGALAAVFAADKRVDLDSPIAHYVPNIKFHPKIDANTITLRSLLTHYSGLPSNPNNRKNIRVPQLSNYFDPTIGAPYSFKELLDAVATTEPKYTAGERYYYSNFGMYLAAYVLTKVSGETDFYQALSTHILTPLQLTNTFVRKSNKHDANMATPYASNNDNSLITTPLGTHQHIAIPPWTFGDVTGALGLSSNILDLSKYIAHLINDSQKPSPLSLQARELLFESNAEFIKDNAHVFEIGLAWRIRPFGRY
ncbi:MAG: serine hydrolase domain-containing protein, partial [Paraglaciecola sp.]|uniref:serine hydrolase domain-containing protein n=1 Tax=Paraglaciecola sp. TaxID=1920173 RepID=UPI0032996F55